MTNFTSAEIRSLEDRLSAYRAENLKLDLTRGKPAPEQLDLSNALKDCLPADYSSEDGLDCRNYGGLEGLPEMRRIFSEILDCPVENVWALGSSSLTIMYDTLVRCLLEPLPGSRQPWSKETKIKFLCPVPGYDRHFFATETLGFELIPVPLNNDGPDMDIVESLVSRDSSIKGMWAVPLYNNPDGTIYSDETCRRLAAMPTAAPDFRLFVDNAYAVHHLYPENPARIPDMLSLCAQSGNADRVFVFASTSKITWAGSGVACLAASQANLSFIARTLKAQMIGPDKINQLRHARFLKDKAQIIALMSRHAQLLRPKFELVDSILAEEFKDRSICRWTKPRGGYFFSLDLMAQTAAQTVSLARECGVALTPAGSTWPYRHDPADSNLRLAPSFPSLVELEKATRILATCIKLAAARQSERG